MFESKSANSSHGIEVEFVGSQRHHRRIPGGPEPTQHCCHEFHCEITAQVRYRLDFLSRIAKSLAMSQVAKNSRSDLGRHPDVCKMNSTDATITTGRFVEFLVLTVEVEDADDEHDDGNRVLHFDIAY